MSGNNPFNSRSDDGGGSITDRDGSPSSDELKGNKRQSSSSGSILPAPERADEPDMSFGEPLH
ncbi:hypothetical protein GGH12_006280, partial [Coemansia sp. RSA 1822]